MINNEIIERSIEGTIKSDACVVGVPVKDTIKRANKEGYIIDAMVVEEFTTNQVRFVQGDYKNIKVTTPEDIDIAELFIELDAK